MRFLRVTTPTRLDIREIVTLGMTTKANTDKIGHKGSGLKFTLAYLHRLGGCLQARSVDYHLRSELFTARIREVDHQMIRLKSAEGDQIWEAHITTQAGADTWTEPWFILREMRADAVAEGGKFSGPIPILYCARGSITPSTRWHNSGWSTRKPFPKRSGPSCKSP
jgi:hypothetical protein